MYLITHILTKTKRQKLILDSKYEVHLRVLSIWDSLITAYRKQFPIPMCRMMEHNGFKQEGLSYESVVSYRGDHRWN